MFKKYVVICLSLLVVFCSCESKESKEDAVIRMLGEELQGASLLISNNTNELRKAFNECLVEPISMEKALIWQPKVNLIEKESNFLFDLINNERLKSTIDWEILAKALKSSKEKILSIDIQLTKEFANKIKRVDEPLDSLDKKDKLNFLYSISHKTQQTILLKVFNRIKILENDLIRYCFYNSKRFSCGFDSFGILIGQSTTHLKPGEQLEISAGVGAFSTASKPYITIDNKKLETLDGLATYKTRVNGTIGKHFIPVKVEFTDENGKVKITNQTVEYTIDK
jgi:hypothetical protein